MMRVRDEADTVQLTKIRIKEPVRAALERAAFEHGVTMNAEVARRLEASFEHERAAAERERTLAEAIFLIYGPDNGPLLHLVGEVLRSVDPRGQWRDDPAKGKLIVRGIARLLHRLQTPDDANILLDGSAEARIDALLLDIGNDGSDHPGSLAHVHRWAEEIRRRLGPLGPLLIEMRRIVRSHLEAMPARETPQPNPEHDEGWDRAKERAAARHAEEARHENPQTEDKG
jgi:hypothetical protein